MFSLIGAGFLVQETIAFGLIIGSMIQPFIGVYGRSPANFRMYFSQMATFSSEVISFIQDNVAPFSPQR